MGSSPEGVEFDPAAALRQAGLRVTAPRVAVLRELAAAPHADVEAIVAAVRARLGSVSVQAVYDVLRVLTGVGLVKRFEPAGFTARYELNDGDNHHHFVCRHCGHFEDVACSVGEAPCLNLPAGSGLVIDEAQVIYWGICASCVQRLDLSPTDPRDPTGSHRAHGAAPAASCDNRLDR